MGIAEGALLAVRSLVAVLEATTISNAPKDAGDKLRVILKTKAEERLVLFIEIAVQASIEGIRVLIQLWRIRVVIEKVAVRRTRVEFQEVDGVLVESAGRNDV